MNGNKLLPDVQATNGNDDDGDDDYGDDYDEDDISSFLASSVISDCYTAAMRSPFLEMLLLLHEKCSTYYTAFRFTSISFRFTFQTVTYFVSLCAT